MDAAEVLAEADLANADTDTADYNAMQMADIMESFTTKRLLLINAFQHLARTHPEANALHPRLRTPMRPVDLGYFIAEHDDHHLARITEICEVLEVW